MGTNLIIRNNQTREEIMSDLNKYMEIENKIERLTQFFDDNGQWQENYVDDCPDFINGYEEVLFDTFKDNPYYEELNCDIKEEVKQSYEENIDLIYNNCTVELTYGIGCCSNELCSFPIGEIEVQLSGLSDNNGCQDIFAELIKDMTKDEIKEAENNSEYYVSDDYLYVNYSDTRASLILDIENFMTSFVSDKIESLESELDDNLPKKELEIIQNALKYWKEQL